jgi:hypothetical protein
VKHIYEKECSIGSPICLPNCLPNIKLKWENQQRINSLQSSKSLPLSINLLTFHHFTTILNTWLHPPPLPQLKPNQSKFRLLYMTTFSTQYHFSIGIQPVQYFTKNILGYRDKNSEEKLPGTSQQRNILCFGIYKNMQPTLFLILDP